MEAAGRGAAVVADAQRQIVLVAERGGTLMVGQVSSGGRLEVTALGDQMNECARIQSAAKNGTILASKELIERLDSDDATGIDADTIAYTPVAELASARREGDPRRRIDPGRRCVSRS